MENKPPCNNCEFWESSEKLDIPVYQGLSTVQQPLFNQWVSGQSIEEGRLDVNAVHQGLEDFFKVAQEKHLQEGGPDLSEIAKEYQSESQNIRDVRVGQAGENPKMARAEYERSFSSLQDSAREAIMNKFSVQEQSAQFQRQNTLSVSEKQSDGPRV